MWWFAQGSLREAARALRGPVPAGPESGARSRFEPCSPRASPLNPPPEKSVGDPRPPGLPHPGCTLPPRRAPGLPLPLTPSWAQPPYPRCPQNGNQENPSCCGIDGILEAYHHSLRTVQLYGPTNFAPVVTHVAR